MGLVDTIGQVQSGSVSDIARALGVPLLAELGAAGPGPLPLIIEQLRGSKIRVELRGRAAPYQPTSFGGVKQRSALTWYQGNPRATQQVMGPEFGPASMVGKWKDLYIQGQVQVTENGAPTEPIVTALQLTELFYQMAISGIEVRVQWAAEVRFGILQMFVPTYDRVQDIDWRIDFEWNGRDAPAAKTTRAASAGASPNNLLKAINAIDDLLATIEDMPRDVTAHLVATIDDARLHVGKLFALVRAFNTTIALPGALVGAVSAAVFSLVAEMGDEISRMTETSSQRMSLTQSTSTLLRTEDQRRDMGARLAALSEAALTLEEQARRQQNREAVTTIVTKTAETLYTLSVRFYGTPDFAAFLGSYNGISDGVIPAGTQLQIPPEATLQTNLGAPDPFAFGATVHGHG